MKKFIAVIVMICIMICSGTFAMAENDNIEDVENIIREALEEDEWDYEYDEEYKFFYLPFDFEGLLGVADISIFVDNTDVYYLGDTYINVENEYFENVAIFVTLVNNELPYGKLCIDDEDGWVTYEYLAYYGDTYPDNEEILNGVYFSFNALYEYGNGISACANGADPYKTFEDCMEVIEAE